MGVVMTKILLVEDDKSLREIYGVRLLAEGYDIVSAGDGEEALAMAIKERPALILSDVMMPKISGFDMLDILRSATETRDIKVIMMTALSSEDQRARGEQLGADRYLVKSQVGIEDVVRTVHEVLGDLPTTEPATTQAPAAPMPQPAPAGTPTPLPTQMPPVRPDVSALSPQPTPAAPATSATAAPVLPRPTAPFSSSVPRPANLGDRVIHPLENISLTPTEDVAKLMEEELEGIPHLDIPENVELPKPADPEALVLPTAPVAPTAPATPAKITPDIAPVTADTPDVAPPQPAPKPLTPETAPTTSAQPIAMPTLPTPSTPPTSPELQPPAMPSAPTLPRPNDAPRLSQLPSHPPTPSTEPHSAPTAPATPAIPKPPVPAPAAPTSTPTPTTAPTPSTPAP